MDAEKIYVFIINLKMAKANKGGQDAATRYMNKPKKKRKGVHSKKKTSRSKKSKNYKKPNVGQGRF